MSLRYLALTAALVACSPRADVGQTTGMQKVTVEGHDLFVPPGFTISVFARDLRGVRYLALGPGNEVWASQPGPGRIIRLPDANHDGVADSAITVLSGLNFPFGLAFRGDTLYFAQMDAVRRLDPGAAVPVTLAALPAGGNHITRTLVMGADAKMYVAVGSSCNLCEETDPRRAAVTRYNLDGSGAHLFASGIRNSVGVAFNPATGELWAVNNDRDNLGDDLPPEHLNILKDGKWYGWPQCYLPGKANPEYADANCGGVEPPAITFQAHSAPLGLAFYTGTAFPAEYRGDAFVTFHGSWNRSIPTGAKVIRVHVQNGRPVSSQDFVTGWQLANGDRWGRPVSLLVLPDGSLLISDDNGGRIWRVSYAH